MRLCLIGALIFAHHCFAAKVPWSIDGKTIQSQAGEILTVSSESVALAAAPALPFELSFEALVPEVGSKEPDFGVPRVWFSVDYREAQDQLAFALRGGRLQDAMAYDFYQPKFVGTKTTKQFDAENTALKFRFHRLPERASAPMTPGKWIAASVRVLADRSELWVNGKYMMTVDRKQGERGSVALGGSWMVNTFRNIDLRPLTAPEAAAVKPSKFDSAKPDPTNTETRRKESRGRYQAKVLPEAPATGFAETSLDGDWLFMPENMVDASAASAPDQGDDNWHVLPVPGFWNPVGWWCWGAGSRQISQAFLYGELTRCENFTFDWKQTSAGWYRKQLMVPASYSGKQVSMEFRGVATTCEVFVNGTRAGGNMGMFKPFSVDLTPHLKPGGMNLVAIRVENGELKKKTAGKSLVAASVTVTDEMATELPHGHYFIPHGEEGTFIAKRQGGIWQSVQLRVDGGVRFGEIWPQTSAKKLKLRVEAEVPSGTAAATRLGVRLKDASGKSVVEKDLAWSEVVAAGELQFPDLPVELWSPESPNLYSLELELVQKGKAVDKRTLNIGFRDFAVQDGTFSLNGTPYRFFGANMPPHGIRPNDRALARKFVALMKEGYQRGTRCHGSPFPAEWLDEMDRQGIAVSYEGQWPWVMCESMPIADKTTLKAWKEEWLALVKANRHRPSIVMWTLSNEAYPMRDKNPERRQKKWEIWQDIVKATREADPTRPLVLDSAYVRSENIEAFHAIVGPNDDGDVDDYHCKPGTYNPSMILDPVTYWDQKLSKNKTPGRPYMSQEPGTAYTNTDLGHQELTYLQTWQGQSWVGRHSYPYMSPAFYLGRTGRITKEQMEIARYQKIQGWVPFCNGTWYNNADSAEMIQPFAIHDAFSYAMRPRLVALMRPPNRVFEAAKVPLELYVVNDAEKNLGTAWAVEVVLKSPEGDALSKPLTVTMPEPPIGGGVSENKIELAVNQLKLDARKEAFFHVLGRDAAGKVISENRYPVGVFPDSAESLGTLPVIGMAPEVKKWKPRFAKLGLSVGGEFAGAPLGVAVTPSKADWELILKQAQAGKRVLVLEPTGLPDSPIWHGAKLAKTYWQGEMADFTDLGIKLGLSKGLKPDDMAWWRGNGPELVVYSSALSFASEYPDQVQPLVDHIMPHGYNGVWKVDFPAVRFAAGQGEVVVCTLNCDALESDPGPFRLMGNLIRAMQQPAK